MTKTERVLKALKQWRSAKQLQEISKSSAGDRLMRFIREKHNLSERKRSAIINGRKEYWMEWRLA